MTWGTPIQIETRRRTKLAVWAYAYEFCNHSLVSDATFDLEACQVNLSIDTARPDLDAWFRANFQPYTGQWIHGHPELNIIAALYYERYIHHV